MTIRRIAALLPFAAALAACRGSGDARTAASPDSAAKVWTPDQARALREARARGDTVPAAVTESAATVVPRPGPAEGEDSARWAAEEKAKYDQRVRSMQPYASCMAQARQVQGEMRAQLEEACGRLPTAPHRN